MKNQIEELSRKILEDGIMAVYSDLAANCPQTTTYIGQCINILIESGVDMDQVESTMLGLMIVATLANQESRVDILEKLKPSMN